MRQGRVPAYRGFGWLRWGRKWRRCCESAQPLSLCLTHHADL